MSYGLKPRTDFCVSPVLNDLKILSDIQSISKFALLAVTPPPSLAKVMGVCTNWMSEVRSGILNKFFLVVVTAL